MLSSSSLGFNEGRPASFLVLQPFLLLLKSLRLNEKSRKRSWLYWRLGRDAISSTIEPKQKSAYIYKKWSVIGHIIAPGIDLPMCERLQKVPSTRKDGKDRELEGNGERRSRSFKFNSVETSIERVPVF
jgi:hypothetical protein